MYEKSLFAGWGDMDFNSHMRNTAYLDKSADVRMMFFAENGFPISEFIRLKIGPVIMKDEVEYYKEIGLLEVVKVTLALAALSEDGSRFHIRNEFFRQDGKLAAKVISAIGWLDFGTRRLSVPPEALLSAMRSLPRTDDFQVVPSRIK
ncbi:MAG: thioesterase family protein [Deltaproteobacteria bacterium]|nr:thioesterase family protein [Deltaproteobacteria bacterium]